MSYTPTNWQTGDTITAQKLNHMEDGISQSASYDLELTCTNEYAGESDDPIQTLTGRGLSFEEVAEKIKNGEDVLVKYRIVEVFDSVPSLFIAKYSCLIEGTFAETTEGSGVIEAQNVRIIFANDQETVTPYITWYDGSMVCSDWVVGTYEYTYNPTTKEFTFTEVQ